MQSSPKTNLHPDRIPSDLNDPGADSLTVLRFLAHLVEETSDILTATDIDFKPITWNRASEKIYGLKAEQVIGRDIREFIDLHYHHVTREEVRQIISTQGQWRGEASFTRPTDQQPVTLLINFKKLKEENGTLLGYLVSATDISNRIEAESRLKESEQRFRDVADSSPSMIWLSDENDITIYANQNWKEFTGQTTGVDPSDWSAIIHPEDRERITAEYFERVRSRKQITSVYRMKRADGNYRWVHDTAVPRFLGNGQFIGYIGSTVDIEDEKRKHEELLYQSTILENVSDIVVTTDLNYRVRIWNKIAEAFYGIPEHEAIGKRLGHLIQFDFYGTTSDEALADLNKKGYWSGEVSFTNKQGETKFFLHTVKFVHDETGRKIGYLAVGHDITEKKRTEEKLQVSESFYRTLIADSIDGMILINTEGTITFASASVKNVLGYEAEEILERNAFEFVHPDDISWAIESLQREVNENPEVKYITIRLKRKIGQWVWCTVRGHNLISNPHVRSVVVYFYDDTLRKQAKDALQESESRFRSLIRDLQIGVFLSDGQGNIIMCNKALSQMLSIPEPYIVGRNVYDIMSNDMLNEQHEFIPIEKRPLTLTLQSKQTVNEVVVGVLHPITGERSWIMVNADPILEEDGSIKHVVCSVLNLNERKKLEQKLITEQVAHQKQLTQASIDGQENERREIGKELHDNIGQQLTTIKLFLDFAKSTADEKTAEMVNMALKGVSAVIDEVRAMSRSLVPFTLKDLGLVESIHELIDSLMRAKALTIRFDSIGFDEGILPENQKLTIFRIIQEQLNNIVKHASARNAWISLRADSKGLLLELRDDGKGFDTEKVRKGVGIINIKNRVELFNGKAEILSLPGEGCLLTISFPLPDAQEVFN